MKALSLFAVDFQVKELTDYSYTPKDD